MTKIANECCDCAVPGYPCMGQACPQRQVPHTYCDICGNEAEEMYEVDDKDVCGDCLVEYLIEQGMIARKK